MHVFVTGGSGLTGPTVVSDLIAAGHVVTGLARSEHAEKRLEVAFHQRLETLLERHRRSRELGYLAAADAKQKPAKAAHPSKAKLRTTSMGMTKEELNLSVVVRRVAIGSTPYGWAIHAADAFTPLHISPD